MRLIALLLLCFCYIEVSAQSSIKGKIVDSSKPKVDSLAPAIVNPSRPFIKLKGDTLEYSIAGVKLKMNATVEELLRRLPGVQVNPDGTIMVNGQKVEKVLVDGEDIFGKDPTTVTRNFNADFFSNIQVLDKKSDRSAFTGIDDGSTTKTLNLVVKEDRKGGYFGQLVGGAGTDPYYDSKGLIGAFENNRQLAAIGLASNTGTTGFTSSGPDGNETVGLSVDAGVDDGLAASAGTGVPRAAGGGVHFSNKWEGRGDYVTANYSYGHLTSFPITSSITQQVLPDTVYLQSQANQSVNVSSEHSFTGAYNLTPDSLSAIHIAVKGHTVSSDNQFASNASTMLNGSLADKQTRTVTTNVQNDAFSGSLYWNRKLNTKGRLLSFTADVGTVNNSTSGYVTAQDYFTFSADTLNQKKVYQATIYLLEGMLNYSEPVTQATALTFTYAASVNQGKTQLNTYNKADGKYTDWLDSLSGRFQPAMAIQWGTVNIKSETAKYAFTGGLDAMWTVLHQRNLLTSTNQAYSYTFLSPHVYGHYTFNDSHILYFSYNSNQQLPAFSQLQPVQNNTDPLHINSGNMQLQPTTSRSFGLRFLRARPSIINVGIQGSFLTNDISSRTATDSLGRQVTEPVNVSGNWNIDGYLGLNRKVLSSIDLRLNLDFGYIRKNNYVNDLLCRNDNYQTEARLSLGKVIAEKYQVDVSSDIFFTSTNSSINTAPVTRYWTQLQTLRINLQLPFGLEWNSNFALTILQKTAAFAGSNKTAIWDSYISSDLFAGRLQIKLKGNDLLGQHMNISRTMSGNQIAETTTNNVTERYLLVYVVYHFTKKKGL